MRFIAKYAKYAVQIQPQLSEAYASGATKIIQGAIIADFTIGEVSGEERALARQMWRFNGFYQEQDLVTIVEPDYRISAFDTRKAQAARGWSDETREQVERTLIEMAIETPQDLIRIEEIRLSPPWPTYDLFSGNRVQLVKKIIEDGFDLAEVLAYEVENQNRRELVAALEQALEDDGEPNTTPEREEELVG